MTAVVVRLTVPYRPPPAAPQRARTRLVALLRRMIARLTRQSRSRSPSPSPPRPRLRRHRGPVLFSEYGWG